MVTSPPAGMSLNHGVGFVDTDEPLTNARLRTRYDSNVRNLGEDPRTRRSRGGDVVAAPVWWCRGAPTSVA